MLKFADPLLFVSLAAVFGGAMSAGAQDTAQSVKISEIKVVGNKALNKTSIIEQSGLKIGQLYSPEALVESAENLRQTGWYGIIDRPGDPKDSVAVTAEVAGGSARVKITVNEYPVIKKIQVSGSGPMSHGEIRDILQSKVGSVFNVRTLQRDVTDVRLMYESRGYQASVSEGLGFHDGVLTVPIVVWRIHELTLLGLEKHKRIDVLKLTGLKVGDNYNVQELKRVLTRLYDTGWFEDVAPEFGFKAPGEVDVTFKFREK